MSAPSQDSGSERSLVWGNYWQHGALHSLPTSYAGNYRGAVANFWTSVGSQLSHEQRLLDIGTGNGSLPSLFHAVLGPDCPRIDAIDLADKLSPAWHQALPAESRNRIVFHPGTQAEKLPFPDGSFDLVCSQYGVEYSDLPAALAEASRVLGSHSRLALVMHHAQSRLVEVAREELKWSTWLSGEDTFLHKARSLYPWLALAAAGRQSELMHNAQATAARAAFNQAQVEMARAIESSPAPDLLHDARDLVASHIDAILSARADADAAIQSSLEWQAAIRMSAFRQQELIAHALDEEAFNRLQDQLKGLSLHIDHAQPLSEDDGMLMGWSLIAHRG